MTNGRKYTNRVLVAINEGIIDALTVAEMCLLYMADDDVDAMLRANDCFGFVDEDEEEQKGS